MMQKQILLSPLLFLFLLSGSFVYAQTIREKGTVVKTKMNCPSLENNLVGDSAERDIAIYLPPGYDNDNMVYPVIYLLGGQIQQFDAWFGWGMDLENWLIRYGVDSYMDSLIDLNIIDPMIIVSPDIRSKYGSAWYTNSVVAGNWEDYIVKDVVEYIDNNYRTIKSAKSRGISGWSAGGYGALKLAMKHPDVFNSVFSISAAPLDLEDIYKGNPTGYRKMAEKVKTVGYDSMAFFIGTPHMNLMSAYSLALAFSPNSSAEGNVDWPVNENNEVVDEISQKWINNCVKKLIPDYIDNLNSLNAIMMESGNNDQQNNNVSRAFKDNNIAHTYNTHDGDHRYGVEERMDTHTLPFFSDTLEQVALNGINTICLTSSDAMELLFKIDGIVYIVPENTNMEYGSVTSSFLKKAEVKAFEKTQIQADNLDNGIYYAIGVFDDQYLSNEVMITVNNEIPEINVKITDFMTGEPKANTAVKLNNQSMTTDENGIVLTSGCGDLGLLLSMTEHTDIDSSFFIYSDTIITVPLVEHSYALVVDKSTGNPVSGAMVQFNGQTKITNSTGLVTIPNMRNRIFMHKILTSSYFFHSDTIPLNPGDTVKISLTKKKADIRFLVQDEDGILPGFEVSLGEANSKTGNDGIAVFYDIGARETVTYSLENDCYQAVTDSFFVEVDTTIIVILQGNGNSPALTILYNSPGDSVQVSANLDGTLYLVPEGTILVESSIIDNQVLTRPLTTNQPVNISWSGFNMGDKYLLVFLPDHCPGVAKSKLVVVSSDDFNMDNISIYPNPVYDKINIVIPAHSFGFVRISEISGKRIFESEVSGNLNQIDLSQLKTGIYLLRVETEHETKTFKLIRLNR